MSSKRRIGTALGDSSKSANKLITDFWGPPGRPKRQKTQDSITEPHETTMAPSLAQPSLAHANLYPQDENKREARDTKPYPQKQHKKVDTAGRKPHQRKDHGKGASTSRSHPVPEKVPHAPKTRHLILAYQKGDLFDAPPNSVLIHACNTIGKWGGGIAATFKKYYPAAFEIYREHCQNHTPDELIGTALLIAPQSDRYWVIRDEESQADGTDCDEADVEGDETKDDKTQADEAEAGGMSVEEVEYTTTNSQAPDITSQDNWIQVPKRTRPSHYTTEQRYDWAPRQVPSFPQAHNRNPTTHEQDIHYVACLFTSRNIGARRDPPDAILQHTESAMHNFLTKLNKVKFKQENCPFIPEVRMCMINSGLFGVPWERTSRLLEEMELDRDQTWGRGNFKVIVVSKDAGGGVSENNRTKNNNHKKKRVLGESGNVRGGRA
ncbi:hypothetical protein QBC40DRAFT_214856 [Triangularia verruculosa]|uniref:ADP-ribose 1''-phosphate phosphatase n=1 Tax=Triangularia verruculosa TaxID=2587418 RepID=A0AAN7B0Y0_9PEZI|nr:hypothetical protein QBC40DRAFT_214856 [Triangularia verruculosa]